MAMRDKNAQAEDYILKQKRLIVPLALVHGAAASITYSSDLPSGLILSMETLTAAAAAIDSGTNFTAPVAANGIIGVLLYNLGTVNKLLSMGTDNVSSGTVALSRKGASSTGVTASGNIAISLDSSLDFTATDFSASIIVDYTVSKA